MSVPHVRLVTKCLFVLVAAVAAYVPAGRVGAATVVTVSAPTFATNTAYCGDGVVDVSGNLVVSGGTSGFASDRCIVRLAEKARLTVVDANLVGASYFDLQGGPRSRVTFDNSSLKMTSITIRSDGSDGPGQRISVLHDSRLEATASSVELEASRGSGGVVAIDQSTIKSGGGQYDSLALYASVYGGSGAKGTVKVENSTLDAGADVIYAVTPTKTEILDSTLSASDVLIRSGRKCTSKGNTPDSPCS